jgi:hypothetical protein
MSNEPTVDNVENVVNGVEDTEMITNDTIVTKDPNEELDTYQGGDGEISSNAILYGSLYIALIVFVIICIIKFRLFNYVWPFFSTYIFIHIRYFWILLVIATVFSSFKMVKLIKNCIQKIKDCKLYTKFPLKDIPTMAFYKSIGGIGRNKKKNTYVKFMKVWFNVMILVYGFAIIVLIFLIMLSCYMVGHLLSWMDYFWFLR